MKNSDDEAMLCIWLVDVDQCCREYLMLLLNTEPFVNCSRSFSSALSLLVALRQEAPPDAILMDMQMSDLSGIEAIRLVKKLAPFTGVLILANLYDHELKENTLTAGASDFLLKRYPLARIIPAIRTASNRFSSH